jgi:hypothetical protein
MVQVLVAGGDRSRAGNRREKIGSAERRRQARQGDGRM